MDRDKILSIINNPKMEDLLNMLKDYCINEHKKPLDATITFINIVSQTPFLNSCATIALDYYKKKFNIIELKNNNNTLLTF